MQILDLTLPCLYLFVICPHIHGPSPAWRTHLLPWADNLSLFIYELLLNQVFQQYHLVNTLNVQTYNVESHSAPFFKKTEARTIG